VDIIWGVGLNVESFISRKKSVEQNQASAEGEAGIDQKILRANKKIGLTQFKIFCREFHELSRIFK
jgi:hypothetical protein